MNSSAAYVARSDSARGIREHITRSRLARHAADCIARDSRRGWRLDKPGREVNIDAIIALCMALDRMEDQPTPVQLIGWI